MFVILGIFAVSLFVFVAWVFEIVPFGVVIAWLVLVSLAVMATPDEYKEKNIF